MAKQFRMTCIFCGSNTNPMSQEHIWPAWMGRILEPTPGSLHTSSTDLFDGQSFVSFARRGRLHKPKSNMYDQRINWVCRPCNNGWMSGLQTKAKPIVERYLKNEWPLLSVEEQASLASWLSMTTAVIDFADVETSAMSADQRFELLKSSKPPEQSIIWIGQVEGLKWKNGFNHFSLPAAKLTVGNDPFLEVRQPGELPSQSTTVVAGSLLATVFTARIPTLVLAERLADTHSMQRIWPPRGKRLIEAKKIHDDESANEVSKMLLPEWMAKRARPAWVTL